MASVLKPRAGNGARKREEHSSALLLSSLGQDGKGTTGDIIALAASHVRECAHQIHNGKEGRIVKDND